MPGMMTAPELLSATVGVNCRFQHSVLSGARAPANANSTLMLDLAACLVASIANACRPQRCCAMRQKAFARTSTLSDTWLISNCDSTEFVKGMSDASDLSVVLILVMQGILL